jgi:hypothetical protein
VYGVRENLRRIDNHPKPYINEPRQLPQKEDTQPFTSLIL